MMRYIFICLAFLCSLNAQADELTVPPLKHRVTDLTATLDANQQAALESRLAQFEQAKGSQIAVLIVPSTQPEAIEQYSIRVTDVWKIGRKSVDDGLLILVAKDDRKMRIEVGYGLEGVIPDVIAKRIIAEVITPYFKQGDYYGGLNAGLDKIFALVDGESLPPPSHQAQGQDTSLHGLLPMLLFGGVMMGLILRAIFGSFVGGAVTGGVIGLLVWILGGGLLFALVLGFIAFVVTLLGVMSGGPGIGGYSGGSGGFGNGGFSGGGGGFGGGGASGDW